MEVVDDDTKKKRVRLTRRKTSKESDDMRGGFIANFAKLEKLRSE